MHRKAEMTKRLKRRLLSRARLLRLKDSIMTIITMTRPQNWVSTLYEPMVSIGFLPRGVFAWKQDNVYTTERLYHHCPKAAVKKL